MIPRERVNRVLVHQQPDRIPVYGWVSANQENVISRRFGSVENFEDKYEFDYAHLFGNSSPYPMEQIEKIKVENGGESKRFNRDNMMGVVDYETTNRKHNQFHKRNRTKGSGIGPAGAGKESNQAAQGIPPAGYLFDTV